MYNHRLEFNYNFVNTFKDAIGNVWFVKELIWLDVMKVLWCNNDDSRGCINTDLIVFVLNTNGLNGSFVE